MSKNRASIFGGDETGTLDIASFAPKTVSDVQAPPVEEVRAVAQAANIHSRAGCQQGRTKEGARSRQYRTGRMCNST
jgi:hypothetical protein